ncbi:MAG: 23S rRNA (uracil(1939)-C(5))-methyltransferase RlmD [Erysipelotrichales bacterium]|nr:23S rRNA (uracil(1939)-C(5))-methyltransferase RlmD [Erysipelotrichales bacterium]
MSEDKFILDIKRLGINSEGIGYWRKKAVFVDNALPKEKIAVKVKEEKPNHILAENIEIIQASSNREKPFCAYYDKCGGCQNQHIKYEAGLQYKRETLLEALKRYANVTAKDVLIRSVIGMKNPTNYRNKSSLPLRFKAGKTKMGLYQKNSNQLVEIESCPIHDQRLNKINMEVCKLIDKMQIPVYDPKTKKGFIKFLITRIAYYTGEAQVTLILDKQYDCLKLAQEIFKIEGVSSVYQDIKQEDDSFNFFSGNLKLLWGEKTITEKLDKYQFKLLPDAFFQLNSQQTKVLYEEVKSATKLNKRDIVFDCYCGVGTISTYLADSCLKVIGIDNNKDAIKNAISNARLNNQTNMEFIAGDVEATVRKLIVNYRKIDCLIVDPPREGLKHFLKLIEEIKPKKIIYISCNLSTLAKDLAILKKNYKIKEIQPVDMFPFSAILESVVILEYLATNKTIKT